MSEMRTIKPIIFRSVDIPSQNNKLQKEEPG